MTKENPFEIGDVSGLSQFDRAEVSRLRAVYEIEGSPALDSALADLCKRDTVRYIRLMRAILPHQIRQAMRDQMVCAIRENELDQLLRALEANLGQYRDQT